MRGRTPLHDAAEQGSPEVVKMLLKAGAKHDIIDNDKDTPLHKVYLYLLQYHAYLAPWLWFLTHWMLKESCWMV